MPRHLAKVKKKMNIYAKRRVRNVLNGNYGSVFKGRGMDFDDIRPYDYGDDVKDIDWKASARSRSLMVRRYVAVRKHNIMLVMDSGRNMSAITPSNEAKSEVALLAASTIAYIADRNGDLFGITFGNSSSNSRSPLKEGLDHIENCLNKYERSVSLDSDPADMTALLSYVSKNYRERMFLFIITDGFGVAGISENIIKRLLARHEIMIIMIEDSYLTNQSLKHSATQDVTEGLRLSQFYRYNRSLIEAEEKMRTELKKKTMHDLKRLGICSCSIAGSEPVVPEIFKMLEEQKHVRR